MKKGNIVFVFSFISVSLFFALCVLSIIDLSIISTPYIKHGFDSLPSAYTFFFISYAVIIGEVVSVLGLFIVKLTSMRKCGIKTCIVLDFIVITTAFVFAISVATILGLYLFYFNGRVVRDASLTVAPMICFAFCELFYIVSLIIAFITLTKLGKETKVESQEKPKTKLYELKKLCDDGIITEEECKEKSKKYIESI